MRIRLQASGRAIGDRSGSPDPSSTSKHLFGRLAIALWRGNACLWLHRHPHLSTVLRNDIIVVCCAVLFGFGFVLFCLCMLSGHFFIYF